VIYNKKLNCISLEKVSFDRSMETLKSNVVNLRFGDCVLAIRWLEVTL